MRKTTSLTPTGIGSAGLYPVTTPSTHLFSDLFNCHRTVFGRRPMSPVEPGQHHDMPDVTRRALTPNLDDGHCGPLGAEPQERRGREVLQAKGTNRPGSHGRRSRELESEESEHRAFQGRACWGVVCSGATVIEKTQQKHNLYKSREWKLPQKNSRIPRIHVCFWKV